ncbi:MAG: hypothetical protein GX760_03245 [Erysipelothrix sp.]|nr:hypothetical protein [Turicibacter sp.]NLC34262.1 hypothetical protein [Erysipelothrix sp.]
MSQLQNDPIRVIPKRVLQLALVITFLIVVIAMAVNLPMLKMLVGYWLGVIANLINFRLIVIGTKNALEQQEKGAKSMMKTNLLLRLVIYAGVLVGVVLLLGTESFITTLIGISMVRFAIQTDGFFTFGYGKNKK